MEDVSRSKEVVGGCDMAVIMVDGDGDSDGDSDEAWGWMKLFHLYIHQQAMILVVWTRNNEFEKKGGAQAYTIAAPKKKK